jgi:hypothetical protein
MSPTVTLPWIRESKTTPSGRPSKAGPRLKVTLDEERRIRVTKVKLGLNPDEPIPADGVPF